MLHFVGTIACAETVPLTRLGFAVTLHCVFTQLSVVIRPMDNLRSRSGRQQEKTTDPAKYHHESAAPDAAGARRDSECPVHPHPSSLLHQPLSHLTQLGTVAVRTFGEVRELRYSSAFFLSPVASAALAAP